MLKLSNKIGKIGEDTACVFLMKRGFVIKDRNYLKRWGEIDIIAEKQGVTHFVEVKSKSVNFDVAHETAYRPEENVHWLKQNRLKRVLSTYIAEKGVGEGKWQFDIVSVYLDSNKKQAKVEYFENIIL